MEPAFNLSLSGWGVLASLLLAVVGHELGHLLVAWRLRIPVRYVAVGLGPALWRWGVTRGFRLEIRLVPVGMAVGLAARWSTDGRGRRPLRQDMAVAAGGPLANLLTVLGVLAWMILARPGPEAQAWGMTTAVLSSLLAIYNLAPLPGLDGGHLLILGAACLGLELSPRHEGMLHRTGLRLTAIVCMFLLAARLAAF